MPRYIDADALAKTLNITEECKDCAYHWGTHNGGFFCGKSSDFANACEAIYDAPTADVHPVVHGYWIKIVEDFDIDEPLVGRCSACGWFAGMYEADVVGMNYCPNCGAKMDGER